MKNTTRLGSIGESKVITRLLELGFSVFVPAFDRNERFDLVAAKGTSLYKLSVKTTTTGSYPSSYDVRLRSCRSNTKGNKTRHFNESDCDVVAVYILPLDKICFVKSSDLSTIRSAIIMRQSPTMHRNGRKQWIIDDYTEFPAIL